MNEWKLVAAGDLQRTETENPPREEGKVRVRVTKVLVNGTDSAIFGGALKVRFPIVPGRYAVGIVAEDAPHLPKGTRLLLHAVIDAPDTGTSPKNFTEDDFLLCGRTTDGYLRELISVPPASPCSPISSTTNTRCSCTTSRSPRRRSTGWAP